MVSLDEVRTVATWATVLVVLGAAVLRFVLQSGLTEKATESTDEVVPNRGRGPSFAAKKKVARGGQQQLLPQAKKGKTDKDTGCYHDLLVSSVKNPTGGTVTCVAVDPMGKQLAIACTDSSVRVTRVNLEKKDPFPSPMVSVRGVLEGMDIATAMDFSVDGKSLFAALEYRTNLTHIKLDPNDRKNTLKQIFKSDTIMHKSQVRTLISSKGKWVLTAGEEEETEIKLWSYSGDFLVSCDTKQLRNLQLTCSPMDGKFFGTAAWTSGVKLWEIISNKEGGFAKLERAIDMKTTCGTFALALSCDNQRAVIVTKDNVVILWNIDIRYKVSEDPKKLASVREDNKDFINISLAGFSPSGKHIVVSSQKNIKIYNASDLTTVETIIGAHGSHIDRLVVPNAGNYFITSAFEERPRLWRFP